MIFLRDFFYFLKEFVWDRYCSFHMISILTELYHLGRLVHQNISNAICGRKKGIAVYEHRAADCTGDRSTFPFRHE